MPDLALLTVLTTGDGGLTDQLNQLIPGVFVGRLLEASGVTLALTALAMPLAIMFGLALTLIRKSRIPLLSHVSLIYIEVVRGTPLLVQLFLVYFTLPKLGVAIDHLAAELTGYIVGAQDFFTWDSFPVGVFCLAANYAAYQAEILRAGIEAVDKGQREAALSLGMTERRAFTLVVWPQAFRIVVPPIINDLIAMMKDSCLVYVIGVQELLTVATSIGKARINMPEMLLAAAVIYLAMSLVAATLGRLLERKFGVTTSAKDKLARPDHGH